MSAAELKEMRKEVKKYIDQADERMVNIVYAILEADKGAEKDNINNLSPEQEKILDEHVMLYENGKMEFSTWKDARSRITSK
jgi:hypothetical protein